MDKRTRRMLIERLNRDGAEIAAAYGLRPRSIEAERANVKNRYGVCYDDGTIKIRLHHVVTGEPLRYSSLVNTLCHELAHLRHFHHGPAFREFYAELLAFARRRGLYRPSNAGRRAGPPLPTRRSARPAVETGKVAGVVDAKPRQLTLF